MNPYLAEFVGTLLLVLFGNGVVCNVLLSRTKGNGGGWLLINAGWGLAVTVAVFCTMEFSGAHLNPAVTIALAAAAKFAWSRVGLYILAQMLGAIVGAALVWWFYRPYFDATESADAKLACFGTAPNIRSIPNALFCEIVGTFALVLPLFLMASPSLELTLGGDVSAAKPPKIGLGALGALPVGLVVLAIGMSLGGTTGYAINPARDLGPRIAHFLLPIRGKRDSDWSYALVPVLGPIAGGLLAAAAAMALALTKSP
jgi:glycerol uptake facilitator protein